MGELELADGFLQFLDHVGTRLGGFLTRALEQRFDIAFKVAEGLALLFVNGLGLFDFLIQPVPSLSSHITGCHPEGWRRILHLLF